MVKALAFAAMLAVNAFVPPLHEGDTVPALPLIDQSGSAFSLAALRGKAVVLSFIYTRCADARMCPLVSLKYARMQRAIAGAPVRLVEVTLDPQFDSPAVLRRYGAGYGADPRRWTLATGSEASIDELAARFGIATRWTAPGTLVHGEAIAVLDPQGTIVRVIDGNDWAPVDVVAVAREAAGERPAPLARVQLWLTAAVEACGGGGLPLRAWEAIALALALTALFGAALVRSLRPSTRA